MKKTIDAEILSLNAIFFDHKKFYQIPDYQRPYSWKKENVSELLSDLFESYESESEDDYFCGSLVLVNNDKRYDIIDGQQRMTTFTILFCVLRDLYSEYLGEQSLDYISFSIKDKYEKNRKLKFLTSMQHQLDFEKTVLEEIVFYPTKEIERDKVLSKNRYLLNAHYIRDSINELLKEYKEVSIDKFVTWLFDKVVLTVITCPNEDTAIQIFSVLNDRGMPLSSTDILKANLMRGISSDNKEDRNKFNSAWEDISKILKHQNYSLDDLLTTYLYYKTTRNPETRLDKELKNVFEKEKTSSLDIVYELFNFSQSYIFTLNGEIFKYSGKSNNRYINCLKYLNHRVYWTSIVTTAIYQEYKELEELLEYLVAYYYQNWISGATAARIKQTSFNVLKAVKEGENIEHIKSILLLNLEEYSTTKNFKEELETNYVYGKRWDRAVLLLVEYFSVEDNYPTFIPINNQLHIEHILPQTTTDYWSQKFTEEDREEWTNKIGNLTLLSPKKNIQAQNFDFNRKKDIYSGEQITSFVMTQDILSKESWDINSLKSRQNELLEKIYKVIDIF